MIVIELFYNERAQLLACHRNMHCLWLWDPAARHHCCMLTPVVVSVSVGVMDLHEREHEPEREQAPEAVRWVANHLQALQLQPCL